MNNKERRDSEMAYIADKSIAEEMRGRRKINQELNTADWTDTERIRALSYRLIGKAGKNLTIVPPFYCDYGNKIEAGDNFFMNYNCTITDVGKVKIGNNVLFGPAVSVYTAGHPIHPEARNSAYEYGIGVSIGDNVWVGGSTVIVPGVHIGNDVVIGAGSVVTKDIPDHVVAAGNPCRVIREITEEDRKYYYKKREFDAEAWEAVKGKE